MCFIRTQPLLLRIQLRIFEFISFLFINSWASQSFYIEDDLQKLHYKSIWKITCEGIP